MPRPHRHTRVSQVRNPWIVHDEHRDIGAVLVAQAMDFLHVTVTLVSKAPKVIEVLALLHVVGLICMHQPQSNMAEVADAE